MKVRTLNVADVRIGWRPPVYECLRIFGNCANTLVYIYEPIYNSASGGDENKP